jgi:hypothetical protein
MHRVSIQQVRNLKQKTKLTRKRMSLIEQKSLLAHAATALSLLAPISQLACFLFSAAKNAPL